MSKRGMSMDEKCDAVAKLFYDHQLPLSMAECQKIIPKKYPTIRFPMIKDIMANLISEGKVEQDKIGAANFYWCFQSAAGQKEKKKENELEAKKNELQAKLDEIQQAIEKASVNKEETEERLEKDKKNQEFKKRLAELNKDLGQYEELDPVEFEKLKKKVTLAKDATNRWTDNILSMKTYCKNKFSMDSKAFDQNFELPENFDYMED